MSLIKRLLIPVSQAFFGWLGVLDEWRGRARPGDISVEQLLKKQFDASTKRCQDFVVVDVRSDAECSVSMIPGAITRRNFQRNIEQYREKTAMLYCTAGGRSYLYARKLAKEGIHALNLRSGIVGWCNAGLPLETTDGQRTNRVHLDDSVFRVPEEYEAVH